ncbi:MAG: PspC domain-containing protein, partial [Actinomycetota bacterium]|nr:PspC domain-containing protein [Actinomycetota bacterium]
PRIVRVVAVVSALLGPGLVLYLAAWLLLPDQRGRIRLERAVVDGDIGSLVLTVGVALAAVAALGTPHHTAWLPLVAAGVVVAAVVCRRGSAPRACAGRPSGPVRTAPSGSDHGPQDAPSD